MCETGKTEKEELDAAKRIYERCIEIRNFEISQLSSRNNFLMIFQGVLFAGLIQSQGTIPIVSFIACLTGTLISFYQTKIAAGAKYWQEHWESELVSAEKRLIRSLGDRIQREPILLFSKESEDIKTVVKSRLETSNIDFLTKKLILRKYSVSRVPIHIGVFLILAWTALLLCTVNFGWSFTIFDWITGFRK